VASKEGLVVNREATMTAARPVMLAVVSATWQRTAAKVKNATTADVWATSAATAIKLPKLKFATDANNPATSPAIVPTIPSNKARRVENSRGLIASDHPHHELFVEPCSCHHLETKKMLYF